MKVTNHPVFANQLFEERLRAAEKENTNLKLAIQQQLQDNHRKSDNSTVGEESSAPSQRISPQELATPRRSAGEENRTDERSRLQLLCDDRRNEE
jgi:hypothetical protein